MKKNNGCYPRTYQTRLISLVVVFLVLIPVLSAAAGRIQIIASASSPAGPMDDKMVQRIFLGKTKSWSDGRPVEIAILKSGATHERFLKAFIKKTPSQYRIYWKKQVFTGKGKIPRAFDSQEALAAYVAKTPGTIGYADSENNLTGVTVLNEK